MSDSTRDIRVLAESTIALAAAAARMLPVVAAERDAAHAELAALHQRIEALCDEWQYENYDPCCPDVLDCIAAVRAALAGAAPAEEER